MKADKLRPKTLEQLKSELANLWRERFNLRMQKILGDSAPKTHLHKKVRVNIARIKTIIRERRDSKHE